MNDARPSDAMGVRIGVTTACAAALWCFWPTLVGLVQEWRHDANYSAGALVPLIAAYLLWSDRAALAAMRRTPSAWGLLIVVGGVACWLAGVVWLFDSAQRFGLWLVIAGLVASLGGWRVLRRTQWVLLFLLLMLPLPGRLHNAISGPLQGLATSGAVFLLETTGTSVSTEGHTMWLRDGGPVAVAEACSGLRMLTAFVIVAATFALMAPRPGWQRAVLLLSSVPIAIGCNLIRLAVTALLIVHSSSEAVALTFHDFAGLLMMPMAIALLLGEMWLLGRLWIDAPTEHDDQATPTVCRSSSLTRAQAE